VVSARVEGSLASVVHQLEVSWWQDLPKACSQLTSMVHRTELFCVVAGILNDDLLEKSDGFRRVLDPDANLPLNGLALTSLLARCSCRRRSVVTNSSRGSRQRASTVRTGVEQGGASNSTLDAGVDVMEQAADPCVREADVEELAHRRQLVGFVAEERPLHHLHSVSQRLAT